MKFYEFDIESKDDDVFISQNDYGNGAPCISLHIDQIDLFIGVLKKVVRANKLSRIEENKNG